MRKPLNQPRRLSAATPRPPIRSVWNDQLISLVTAVALLAPLAVSVHQHGVAWLPLFGVSLLTAVFWQTLFAVLRHRSLTIDGIVAGTIVAIMAGPDVPLWQAILAVSFGVVVGEQVFGGRGHNFLSPAVAALAFLMFSFPNTGVGEPGQAMAIAGLLAAILLLATGLISWRIVVSAVVGLVASTFIVGTADPLAGIMTGSFVFALVFLACDPVGAASTNAGRWAYGALFGALTVVLAGSAGAPSTRSVIFAALLASVLAPLIDQIAIAANVYRRRRRYG